MSDIIHFPTKQENVQHVKTPEQALEYVGDLFKANGWHSDNMIVAWVNDTGETVEYRYVIGGNANHAANVGLLEITKSMIIE